MSRTAHLLAVPALLGVLLSGCGDDDDPAPATPQGAADSPCLVTPEQLGEITGTEQTIRESDVPGVETSCDTAEDERGVAMEWSLSEPSISPPPTHEEQRTLVDDPGMAVAEADLGEGRSGWLARGTPAGRPEAQLVTSTSDLMLHVTVTAYDDDAGVTEDDVSTEALELSRAIVTTQE